MLAQKLVTLASNILIFPRMEILPTLGIWKAAHLATGLQTKKIEEFWGASRGGCPGVERKNKINKVYPFWALVNILRENKSTVVMNAAHDILLKDLTFLAHSALPTLSTRRRLLSTWKFVQEHTQKLRCGSRYFKTASKPLKHIRKLRRTLEFTSWDELLTCIICLKSFNNQE